MPDTDPILPGGDAPPAPRSESRKCICEFCECRVTASGEIISVGDKAKRFRKLEDENEKLQGANQTLRDELEREKQKHPEPSGPKSEGRKGLF